MKNKVYILMYGYMIGDSQDKDIVSVHATQDLAEQALQRELIAERDYFVGEWFGKYLDCDFGLKEEKIVDIRSFTNSPERFYVEDQDGNYYILRVEEHIVEQ